MGFSIRIVHYNSPNTIKFAHHVSRVQTIRNDSDQPKHDESKPRLDQGGRKRVGIIRWSSAIRAKSVPPYPIRSHAVSRRNRWHQIPVGVIHRRVSNFLRFDRRDQ